MNGRAIRSGQLLIPSPEASLTVIEFSGTPCAEAARGNPMAPRMGSVADACKKSRLRIGNTLEETAPHHTRLAHTVEEADGGTV